MNLTFYGLLFVSFIALNIHGGSCGNYVRIEKENVDIKEQKSNESMKDVFTKKDKRQADGDDIESSEEEDHKCSNEEYEVRKKRDIMETFEDSFENFKGKAKSIGRMKTLITPKSKREVDYNQVARKKRQEEGENPFDIIKGNKFERKTREALEAPMNNNLLVFYDVRESYDTKYTFM